MSLFVDFLITYSHPLPSTRPRSQPSRSASSLSNPPPPHSRLLQTQYMRIPWSQKRSIQLILKKYTIQCFNRNPYNVCYVTLQVANNSFYIIIFTVHLSLRTIFMVTTILNQTKQFIVYLKRHCWGNASNNNEHGVLSV